MSKNDRKLEALRKYFGYDSFRNGQEPLIDAVLSGRDALGIMPTGGGKSICYQIPAILLEGITFVVSPLISLMQDQVQALKGMGVTAAYVNSTLTPRQIDKVYANILSGAYKIVYVAPERLMTDDFLRLSHRVKISLLAVDEAHCVSQWGHSFRQSYLEIALFVKSLPVRPVVAAFTATATELVRRDIEELLELRNPERSISTFDRPNLSFDVLTPREKPSTVSALVKARGNKSGIIYCSSIKSVESVYERLLRDGVRASKYHSRLEANEKSEYMNDFIYDRRPVMVATSAFGMGINKSNVSYVIHYNMPLSIEDYYQEAGRAGRDGADAECILLYGAGDVKIAKILISSADGELLSDKELWTLYEKEMKRLSEMVAYCKTTDCLRGKILDYFGEKHEKRCGNCGTCKGKYQQIDITTEAQKILSCIARINAMLGFGVGKGLVASALSGGKSGRLLALGLDKISTYGIMKDTEREKILEIYDFLSDGGYIVTEGEHNTAALGDGAWEILKGERAVKMTVSLTKREKTRTESIKGRTTAKALFSGLDAYSDNIYDALRAVRAELAEKEGVPAYVIFTNATLADMAAKMPTTEEAFLKVSGVGEQKARKYGEVFTSCIARLLEGGEKSPETEKPSEESHKETEKAETTPGADANIEPRSKERRQKGAIPLASALSPNTVDPENIYALLLSEASRVIAEAECGAGLRPRVTALLTESGVVCCAVNSDRPGGVSFEERRILHSLEKGGDTRILRMVTLWQDGNVGNASSELYRAVLQMNPENKNAEVLIANSPRNTYRGHFFPKEYKMRRLSDFVLSQ